MGGGALAAAHPGRGASALALVGALILAAGVVAAPGPSGAPGETTPGSPAASPLPFVKNEGQTDASVRYLAQGANHSFYFTPGKAVLDFRRGDRATALELRFQAANPDARIVAERRARGRVNYLIGARPHVNLATYSQLRYRDLWPGIDMVFKSGAGQLKYEFLVRPGADPRDIRLAWAGADSVALSGSGALTIDTALGPLRDAPPRAIQGGREVDSRYVVSGSSYGFALAPHDRSRPLLIDPGLAYSTYLSGDGEDWAHEAEVDAAGNVYVTGDTASTDFPASPGAYDPTGQEGYDAFVTKLGPTGALVYSTLLGGNSGGDPETTYWDGLDLAKEVAVDADGNAYVTGSTRSIDFPTTPGAYVASNPTGEDYEFVTKLNPTGTALVYSTLVGPGVSSWSTIDIDESGHAYIGGQTFSSSYPTTAGAYRTSPGPGYVTKLNPTGTALDYSTYFDGPVYRLMVDSQGQAVLTGPASFTFPTTAGAFDTTHNGGSDVFVTKLNPTGTGRVFSTLLGSSTDDSPSDLALDDAGNTYVSGQAGTTNFPTTPGAYSTSGRGFATKLNPTGSGLVYSTFLPGGQSFYGDIGVDGDGYAYVTAQMSDANVVTTADAFDSTYNGGLDVYLVKLTPTGSALAYATYIGGAQNDVPFDVEADDQDNAYVVGRTTSTDYPTSPGAIDGDGPTVDAFVTKLNTTPFPGYPRPKSASPALFSLVVAYGQCTDPNEIHGPPLAYPSCAAPQKTSDHLTVGTPDANGLPPWSDGFLKFKTLVGNPATPGDEADVALELHLDDVYTDALADYAGELRAQYTVRLTDRDSAGAPGESPAATVGDFPLGMTVPCTPVTDAPRGATCSAATTMDALVPGSVKEGMRAIWALARVRVFDGGADGDGDTVGDNTLFATQGVFIP